MLVVGENASSYISDYSRQFQSDFLALLSRRWGTKRVRANQVYQEFIQDKHHSHMNATRWVTLSAFVQHLSRSGICHVDETEKGWFIAWIDNSPKALAKLDATKKKERSDMDDEERQRRMLAQQMERAKAAAEAKQGGTEASTSGSDGSDDDGDEDDDAAEDDNIDISTMQPIKLTIGGAAAIPDLKGKGKAEAVVVPDVHVEVNTADIANGAETIEASEAVVSVDGPDGGSTVKSTTLEPKAMAGPALVQPKVNALKMLNGKTNPLKMNALKANPFKAASADKSKPDDAYGSMKRPISAVESIVKDELEKKRRREQSTWSSSRGHGREGLQQR